MPQALRSRRLWLVAVASLLMVLGFLLRLPVFDYHGPPVGSAITNYLQAHAGAYTDVAHLFVRDHLWSHPVPYYDYRFEYPVLTGAFVWLVSFVHRDLGAYFSVSSAILLALGLCAVCAIDRIRGANAWILAAAPALAFYASLNWDLLGIALLALALVAFDRDRDLPTGVLLALSVWAKGFAIAVLPVLVAVRLGQRRRSGAWTLALAFAAVSLVVNVPIALTTHGWSYFFHFTQVRPPKATIFKPLLGAHADVVAEPLLVAGLIAIALVALRTRRAMPCSAAALLWVFATAKVYSPQYALWIFAALAIDGAPLAAVAVFAVIDALVFATTFGPLWPSSPLFVQWAAYGARQLFTLALAAMIVRRTLPAGHPVAARSTGRAYALWPARLSLRRQDLDAQG